MKKRTNLRQLAARAAARSALVQLAAAAEHYVALPPAPAKPARKRPAARKPRK